ncbi:MAG: CopG family ribbon-helix-helix protein [Vicinamibacteria bacterium]
MKRTTIRLEPALRRDLNRVARDLGQSRSEVIRQALRRYLSLVRFEEIRAGLRFFAEKRGYSRDDDVFRDVS